MGLVKLLPHISAKLFARVNSPGRIKLMHSFKINRHDTKNGKADLNKESRNPGKIPVPAFLLS
jgi:hypothetical protein